MEGNFKYSSKEVEQIVLEYHIRQMPPPEGMVWVAIEKTYGGVSIELIREKPVSTTDHPEQIEVAIKS